MPWRYTMIMQVTTAPTNFADASAHTGGWTESHWRNSQVAADSPQFRTLMMKRALMLPRQAAITGFRIASYQIVESSLAPLGASTGKVRFPGNPSRETDLPQVALELSGTSGGGNSNRFSARCVPDDVMVGGEYTPNSDYKGYVTQFGTALTNGGFGFMGRDLTATTSRIKSIENNIITPQDAFPANIGGTLLTFIGVKDVLGKAVVGNFRIVAAATAPAHWVLDGLPQGCVVENSGSVRVLTPIFAAYTSISPARAVVRKVGRPFEQYRGRASKRSA